MANNLKISLVATLDKSLSKDEINKKIKEIEGQFGKITLQFKLEDNVLKKINDLTNKLKSFGQVSTEASELVQKNNKKEAKTVDELTQKYSKLVNEVNKYNKDGSLKSKTSTYLDDKGNGRVINTNSKGEVTSYKDIQNLQKFQTEQEKVRKKLIEIAKTGNYTTGELRKIGQSINTASSIRQLDNLKDRMDRLNVASKNETLQKNLLSQANNLLGSGSKKLDTAGVQNLITSLQAIRPNAQNATRELNNLQGQLRNYQTGARDASRHTQTFGDMMSQAFTKFPIWMIASSAFFAPIQGIQKLIENLYVLDERLVSINKVLENADMGAVFDNATRAAETYGQKIDSVLESLGEISKLGFGQQDAEFLNNQAMLLSTVGEFKNNADAANYLVAIMRQYKLEVKDTAAVVDALNHTSNKTGADTASLAQGLSKSSSAAAMAGVTFHELNGMIANTQETLKISGNEAGTFYKTLFTRFLRPETQSVLESVGIATKDMNGELLSATTVLQSLGEQWNNYDSQTKNAIGTQLGGVWHLNKVSSLLENQNNVLKNTEISMNSYGSATTELGTFQEGLQYQTNQMTASFQEMGWVIGEVGVRDFLMAMIEGATGLAKGFTELTRETDGWNIKLPLLAAGIYGIVKAVGALRVAGIGLKASFGWIGLGVVAIEALASVFMKTSSSSTESAEAFSKNAEQMSNQTKTLEHLIAKYDELKPLANDNKDKQQELHDVLSEIQELAPHLIVSTGEYGDALYLNKQKADEYIKSLKTMTDEQVQQAKLANDIEMTNVTVDIDEEQKKLNEIDKKVKDTFESIASYRSKYDVSGINDAEADFNERIEKLKSKYTKAIEDRNGALADSISQQLADVRDEYEKYIKDSKMSDMGEYSEIYGNIEELKAQKTTIEERQKALDSLSASTKENSNANNENADSLSNVAGGHYDAEEGTVAETGALEENTKAKWESVTVAEALSGRTQDEIDKIIQAIDIYNALSQVENLSAQQSEMLAESKAYLASVYPELAGNMEGLVGTMRSEAVMFNVLNDANADAADVAMANEYLKTKAVIANTKTRIAALKAESDALKSNIQSQSAAGKLTDNQGRMMLNRIGTISNTIPNLEATIVKAERRQNEIVDHFSTYDPKTGSAPKVEKPKKDKSSGSGSDKNVEIHQIDRYKMKMDELNDSLEESQFVTKRLDKTSAEYRAELENQSRIYEEMSSHTLGQVSSLEKRNIALKSQIASMGNANRLSNEQKEIFNALNKELEDNTSEIYNMKDAWRGYQEQLLSMQDDIRNSIGDQIAEEQAKREEILEKEIEDTNNAYDERVKVLQDQLDMLDEIEEAEDRIANLREKENEINKAKSDKRYSYITAQGEEILTFNKEQVSELEKERDAMVKEYERADLKKALQDEINRLNKAKDDANKALTQRLNDFKKFWDSMVSDARSGTLAFDTLQRAWTDRTISSLVNHVNVTGNQLNNIGGMYSTLGEIARNMDAKTQQMNTSLFTAKNTLASTMSGMASDASNFGSGYTGALGGIAGAAGSVLGSMQDNANQTKVALGRTLGELEAVYNKLIKKATEYENTQGNDIAAYSGIYQYYRKRMAEFHTGGIVGGSSDNDSEFVNKLFNVKQNETVAKLLNDEVVINPNLPHVKSNIQNLQNLLANGRQVGAIDQSKQYYLSNVKVVANNPMELFNGIDNIVRSY